MPDLSETVTLMTERVATETVIEETRKILEAAYDLRVAKVKLVETVRNLDTEGVYIIKSSGFSVDTLAEIRRRANGMDEDVTAEQIATEADELVALVDFFAGRASETQGA